MLNTNKRSIRKTQTNWEKEIENSKKRMEALGNKSILEKLGSNPYMKKLEQSHTGRGIYKRKTKYEENVTLIILYWCNKQQI